MLKSLKRMSIKLFNSIEYNVNYNSDAVWKGLGSSTETRVLKKKDITKILQIKLCVRQKRKCPKNDMVQNIKIK